MRAPASLRGRLALWLGLALVALWLATALLTAGLMRRELDALFDSALQESAERLLPLAVNDVLGRGPADENDEDDPRILGVIAPHDEFLTYVLRDPAGRVLLQSHAVDPAGFPPWDGPGFRSTATLRLYNIAALRDTVRLTVAEPLAHRARIAREALWMLLLPLLVVVPLAFAAIWLALRAGLAPLQRWRERLAARGARDLSPVSAGDLPSELAPIAATLDDVLCRLSAAFEAERSFAANAAHELRTPLAGGIAQAQRLQAETADPAARMRAAAMEAALKRLLRVSERLMQLARAEGARLRRDSAADLCPVVRILVEEQGRDAGDERIRLRLPEAAVLSDLDRDALAIILRNLIDNALRHGEAPRRCRRDLPERSLHHAPDRCRALRAERRMADRQPIHDGRSLRPDRQGGDRPHSQHHNESRLIMPSGHPENYTTLTDATGDANTSRSCGCSRPSIWLTCMPR